MLGAHIVDVVDPLGIKMPEEGSVVPKAGSSGTIDRSVGIGSGPSEGTGSGPSDGNRKGPLEDDDVGPSEDTSSGSAGATFPSRARIP